MGPDIIHHRALRQCAPKLHQHLNIDAIHPHLQHHVMLTRDESYTLANPNKTPGERVEFTINKLPSKVSGWWEKFINSLKSSTDGTAHGELAKIFEDTLTELKKNGKMLC